MGCEAESDVRSYPALRAAVAVLSIRATEDRFRPAMTFQRLPRLPGRTKPTLLSTLLRRWALLISLLSALAGAPVGAENPPAVPIIRGAVGGGTVLTAIPGRPSDRVDFELSRDSLVPVFGGCGVADAAPGLLRREVAPLQIARESKRRRLDLILVASGDFSAGRTDEAIVDEIVALVRGANRYYDPLGIELNLAGVQIIPPSAADPYADAVRNNDSWSMLDTVRREWIVRDAPSHHLVGVLARSGFRGTLGLAFTATACLDRSGGFFFASRGGDDEAASQELAATIAHEIGHALGMAHDTIFYPNGPSLMWPLSVSHANGFSPRSQDELDIFSLQGGVDCLTAIGPYDTNERNRLSSMDGTLQFEGGSAQRFTLVEGAPFLLASRLLTYEPGATFEAFGVPAGAVFDRRTGILSWTPPFDLVPSRGRVAALTIGIRAQTYSGSGATSLRLTVVDGNRAPRISGIEPLHRELVPGEVISLAIVGVDEDRGDRVTLRGALQHRRGAFDGSLRCRSARCDLSLRARGLPGDDAAVLLTAKDRSGATSSAQIVLRTVALDAAPTLGVSVTSSGESGRYGASVAVHDAEDRLASVEVEAPAPGLIEEWDGKTLKLELIATDAPAPKVLTVVAADGKSRTSVDLTIPLLPKNGSLTYPATGVGARARPAPEGLTTFEPLSGRFRVHGCDGTLRSETFLGQPGDHPLQIRRRSVLTPAVYRLRNGQGYFVEGTPEAATPWGLTQDVPLSGDLDGDGEGELIVFRPRSSEWWIRTSGGQTIRRAAVPASPGSGMRVPFAADIDGDGSDELLLFSRSDSHLATFTAELVSRIDDTDAATRIIRFHLARAGAGQPVVPYVGDFDGDGRADLGARIGAEAKAELRSSSGMIFTAPTLDTGSFSGVGRCEGQGDALIVGARHTGVLRALFPNGTSTAFQVGLEGGLPLRGLLDLQVQRSRSVARSQLGDTGNAGRGVRAVLRAEGGTVRWLQEVTGGGARMYPPLPHRFSYRGFGDFDGAPGGALYSFADGLWILQKESGAESVRWGVAGDVPVPGDYDGDGRDELAVYRPVDASWWIYFRNGEGRGEAGRSLAWGEPGDIPVPADYDGDGRYDFAIVRRCHGDCGAAGLRWFIRHADDSVRVEDFGGAASTPVPGDYLGLGAAQLAVWNEQTGQWSLKLQGAPVAEPVQWGLPGDVPVRTELGDDSIRELAVFRPATGVWHSQLFRDGTVQQRQFGLPADEPLGTFKLLRSF